MREGVRMRDGGMRDKCKRDRDNCRKQPHIIANYHIVSSTITYYLQLSNCITDNHVVSPIITYYHILSPVFLPW